VGRQAARPAARFCSGPPPVGSAGGGGGPLHDIFHCQAGVLWYTRRSVPACICEKCWA
jgi:hypothetical protein